MAAFSMPIREFLMVVLAVGVNHAFLTWNSRSLYVSDSAGILLRMALPALPA